MTRVIRPEILDDRSADQARNSLRDLVWINRYWGGRAALDWLMAQAIPPNQTFSLLDVGAASGDMGAYIRERHPNSRVTSLDYRVSHLEAAEPPKLVADAFRLPFGDRSFDFVFCSLFLHHFSD